MPIHHKIPQSKGGTDDDWNLEEVSDYDHAFGHALDFVLFEHAPTFDCRQPGWDLLPDDLRLAVRKELSQRMTGNRFAVGSGHTRLGSKNGNWGKAPCLGRIRPQSERDAISKANKGKLKSEEHRRKLSKAKLGKKMGPQPPDNPNRIESAKEGWKKRSKEPNRKQWQENNPAKIRTSCLFCMKETNIPSINNFHLNCNQQ